MYGQLPLIKTATGEEVAGFPVQILNPQKIAVLRLPTNEELANFYAGQKSLQIDLGRGATRDEDIPNPRATKRLFDAIRLDKDGVEFDDAEMMKALGRITLHSMESCERVGDKYVVKLATPFDDRDDAGECIHCTHTVRIPFERERAEYARSSTISTNLAGNKTQFSYPIEPRVNLYNLIMEAATGYSDTAGVRFSVELVPVHHKRTVVQAVLYSLALAENNLLDPNS